MIAIDLPSAQVDLRAAWLLAAVEFFFSLGWVVYVIFLPELLARGGVDKRYVPWLLAADQMLFAFADWWLGVAVDKARAALRRIGPMLVLLSWVSAVAMSLMPWLAATPAWFLLATALWVTTSSALRAPPYVLLSRYAGRATMPRLAGIQLLGLATATALAPYLAITLKGVDPTLPFVFCALAVGLTALVLVYVERSLRAAQAPAVDVQAAPPGTLASATWVRLLLLALLLAFGQQLQTTINSAVQFKRLAESALLPWLLPVFWVGFSFGLLLAGRVLRGRSPLPLLQRSCAIGVLALTVAVLATSLEMLLASQLAAGCCWGFILCASIGVASERGSLQTGRNTGALMATLAIATMSRLALTAAGAVAPGGFVEWLPALLWAAAGVLLLGLRAR